MLRRLGGVSGHLIVAIAAVMLADGSRAADGIQLAEASHAAVNPIDELRHDAEHGDVKAQYLLGCCYNGDHGFIRDPVKAAKWWGIAAAKGLADAQFCLGLSCFMGEGVTKDVAEAVKWWRKAADQDHMDAQYFLGLSYHAGIGVPKNEPLAIQWLQKSASQGSQSALRLLKEIGR